MNFEEKPCLTHESGKNLKQNLKHLESTTHFLNNKPQPDELSPGSDCNKLVEFPFVSGICNLVDVKIHVGVKIILK